jgi:hypothetical protein
VTFWGVVMLLAFFAGMLSAFLRARHRPPPGPQQQLSPAEQKARDHGFDRQG